MSQMAQKMRPKELKVFKIFFKRQWLLSFRNFNEFIHPVFYFLVAILTFKIAIGAEKAPLEISIGILFTINIFVLILTHETLLLRDYKLGFLEQFYLIGSEFTFIVFAKYLVHFLTYTLIFAFLAPLILLLLQIETNFWCIILVSQVLLSAVVLLFLLLSSAMLLGCKSKALLSMIVLIFTFPVLIFATLSVNNLGYLWLLLAMLLFFMPIAILSSKYLVLIALEDRG